MVRAGPTALLSQAPLLRTLPAGQEVLAMAWLITVLSQTPPTRVVPFGHETDEMASPGVCGTTWVCGTGAGATAA